VNHFRRKSNRISSKRAAAAAAPISDVSYFNKRRSQTIFGWFGDALRCVLA
jgi:hypothetical protein